MIWNDRVDGSPKTLMLVQKIMAKAGPGIAEILEAHGVTFLELSPGVPFAAIPEEYFPEERERKAHATADEMGYGMVEGFYNFPRRIIVLRNPDEYVIAHELGHALDHALYWFGTDTFIGRDDRSRYDHVKGVWNVRQAREPFSQYAMTHPRERFAETFAAYLDTEPGTFGRYHIDRLRATDRTAAALMRRIFREANGSAFEFELRPAA